MRESTVDGAYAPFSKANPNRVIAMHEIELANDVTVQYRVAVYQIANGETSIDEAIAKYGHIRSMEAKRSRRN